jgi:glycosyltransferase involved in cell wall biosynthesis
MVENKKKIKVAFLLGSLNRGGTETLVLDCFRNHNLTDISIIGIYRKEGDLFSDYLNSGVPLYNLRIKHFIDFKIFFKLRKLLKDNNIQLIHSHQPIDAFYAYFATIGLQIKSILTFHGFDFKLNKLAMIINKFVIHRTDLNIFVSDYQKKYYQKKYNLTRFHKQKVVYNGVSFSKLEKVSSTSLYEENSLKQKKYTLGTVGNFVSVRDQLIICKFLHLLNQQNIPFNFFFIGAQDKSEPLKYDECVKFCKEHELRDSVHFLGSRNDVPSILKQLDAFIYATNYDTFGISVIEAIASEVPVFVNDWKVMLEITENGKYAEIYQTKSEEDLMNKFTIFLSNPESYKQKAIVNSYEIKQKFSIQHHLHHLQTIYSTLLES